MRIFLNSACLKLVEFFRIFVGCNVWNFFFLPVILNSHVSINMYGDPNYNPVYLEVYGYL